MKELSVGKRLSVLRGDRKRGAVAKALGISKSALAMYEQDNRIPRDEVKIKIAEYYGLSVQAIFFDGAHIIFAAIFCEIYIDKGDNLGIKIISHFGDVCGAGQLFAVILHINPHYSDSVPRHFHRFGLDYTLCADIKIRHIHDDVFFSLTQYNRVYSFHANPPITISSCAV